MFYLYFCTILPNAVQRTLGIFFDKITIDNIHPSLDIVNEPVRPLLFTISSHSLYQGIVKNEIFNIGNGFPITTNELLREIERNLNLKAKIKAVKVSNESKYTHANLKKSRKILGYNPIVSFEVGIKRFLDWHKSFEK